MSGERRIAALIREPAEQLLAGRPRLTDLEAGRGQGSYIKHVFYQSAFCALQRDPTSRAFYDRKRAGSKRHHQALTALARSRVSVLYAMLRDRKAYETRTPRSPIPLPT